MIAARTNTACLPPTVRRTSGLSAFDMRNRSAVPAMLRPSRRGYGGGYLSLETGAGALGMGRPAPRSPALHQLPLLFCLFVAAFLLLGGVGVASLGPTHRGHDGRRRPTGGQGSFLLAPSTHRLAAGDGAGLPPAPCGEAFPAPAASPPNGAPESPAGDTQSHRIEPFSATIPFALAPVTDMQARSDLPPEIQRQLKRWNRQLSRLSRSIARDFARAGGVPLTEDSESGETRRIRSDLCHSLAQALAPFEGRQGFLPLVDQIAARLRLPSPDLLFLIFEGERGLAADETKPQAPAGEEQTEGGAG